MDAILNISIFVSVTWLCYFTGKRLFGTPGEVDNFSRGRIATVSVLIGFATLFMKSQMGAEIPGHWYEKSDYKREFYVNLFPDQNSSRNYRVPGLISATFTSDEDAEGHINSWRVYRLQRARFPNEGVVTFNNSEESLRIGKRVYLRDDSGREWYAELTQVPVK